MNKSVAIAKAHVETYVAHDPETRHRSDADLQRIAQLVTQYEPQFEAIEVVHWGLQPVAGTPTRSTIRKDDYELLRKVATMAGDMLMLEQRAPKLSACRRWLEVDLCIPHSTLGWTLIGGGRRQA